jgi:hypothetical protein
MQTKFGFGNASEKRELGGLGKTVWIGFKRSFAKL